MLNNRTKIVISRVKQEFVQWLLQQVLNLVPKFCVQMGVNTHVAALTQFSRYRPYMYKLQVRFLQIWVEN